MPPGRYPTAMILKRNGGRSRWVAVGGAALLLAAFAQPAHATDSSTSGVARQIKNTLAALQFGQVLDTAPPGSAAARSFAKVDPEKRLIGNDKAPKLSATAVTDATQIHQQPNIDVTVIELDSNGRAISSGTAVTSPQYPTGVAVPVDRNLHTTAVR